MPSAVGVDVAVDLRLETGDSRRLAVAGACWRGRMDGVGVSQVLCPRDCPELPCPRNGPNCVRLPRWLMTIRTLGTVFLAASPRVLVERGVDVENGVSWTDVRICACAPPRTLWMNRSGEDAVRGGPTGAAFDPVVGHVSRVLS